MWTPGDYSRHMLVLQQPYVDLQARAIVHLAANPSHLLQDDIIGRAASLWSYPCHLQTVSDSNRLIAPSTTTSLIMRTGNFL